MWEGILVILVIGGEEIMCSEGYIGLSVEKFYVNLDNVID